MNRNAEHGPPPMTPGMRAALMAGSLAKWQKRHNPYPIVVPEGVQGVLPMSLRRAHGVVESERLRGDGGRFGCWCLDRMLRSCDHPEHATVFSDKAVHEEHAGYGQRRISALQAGKPQSWVDTDVDFDGTTYATTIKVWSAFTDVPRQKGEGFIKLAEPPNWQTHSGLFKKSIPGTWDPARSEFTPGQANGSEYYLYEQAEWEWTPEVSGGLVNILKITNEDRNGPFTDVAKDVLEHLISEAKSKERKVIEETLKKYYATSATYKTRYKYNLHRSIQSRLVSAWQPGGLAKDDGEYAAAWFPSQSNGKSDDRGLLCIRITKELLFSRQADVFADYSKLLNLLAPALGSLLMEQLAHDGVLWFLKQSANPPSDGDQPVGQRPSKKADQPTEATAL